MNSDQVKQALLDLLNADTEKGRTWFFPSNVSDRYTVILGLDLKQSAKAIGTALISVLLAILIFRSTAVFPLIIYVIVGLVSFGGVWAFYGINNQLQSSNVLTNQHMILKYIALGGAVALIIIAIYQFYKNNYNLIPSVK